MSSSLDLSKLSLGSGLPSSSKSSSRSSSKSSSRSSSKSSVKNQPSIPETHDIPSSVTELLRGQMSNVEAHLELLGNILSNVASSAIFLLGFSS